MIAPDLHLNAALTWYDQGFCVMPARHDGSKRPVFEWKKAMGRRPKRSTVESWHTEDPRRGVGLICGKVSGNLEMTELEGDFTSSGQLDKLRLECDARNITWLWDLLTLDGYAEWTANGGVHTLYRISDHGIPGNTKLATDATGKITYAETRGEGGFVIVAPTTGMDCGHGGTHPEGDTWNVAAGEIGVVPTITWADRCLLHEAIKAAFDERVKHVIPAPAPRPIRERQPGEISPQDDFNERGDWNDILASRGWQYAGQQAGQELWTRPGKDVRQGHSAALGHNGSPNLYVWSGMPEERHYTKAQFICYSDFNGDFAATTKHLAREGYGTPLPARIPTERYDHSDFLPPVADVEAEALETAESQPPHIPASAKPRVIDWTHVGVGRFAAKACKDQFHEIFEEKGSRGDAGWRFYDKGAWTEDREKRVGRAMEALTDEVQRQARLRLDEVRAAYEADASEKNKNIVKAFEKDATFAKSCASDAGIKAITNRLSVQEGVARSIMDFDKKSELLCLGNGTFNVNTMQLQDHNASDRLTRRMSIDFDPEAQCPLWEQSMQGWIPDAEMRDYVQRALGYTLLGTVEEGVFFVPWGETGCGKSQFIETLTELFGDFGTTAEASTFRDKGWGSTEATNNLHDLRGKRFVASSETSKGAGLNEELVKRATGEDALTTRALFQSNMRWKPSFVLWIATNFKPSLSSEDDAIWRRVKPIHFPNNFYDTEARIKGLGNRLVDEELAGIFNWLLEGVRKYRELGLAEPASMRAAVQEYRDEQDPVAQFLAEAEADDKIVRGAGEECEASKLYNVFAAYCTDNNLRLMDPRRFGRSLSSKGFETRKGSAGTRMRSGIGIRWLANTRPAPHDDWTRGKS